VPRGQPGPLAAVAAAATFVLALPLVATEATEDPVGARYDDWNRVLTIPLVFLLGALIAVRARVAPALGRNGRVAAAAMIVGGALLVLGNVVEFWLALFQDKPVSAQVDDREGEYWVGSTGGWLTFLLGSVVLLVAAIVVAVAARRAGVVSARGAAALGLVVPLLFTAFVVWAFSTVLTAIVGVVLAVALLQLAAELRPS
jgi:uncharacterized membrane protein